MSNWQRVAIVGGPHDGRQLEVNTDHQVVELLAVPPTPVQSRGSPVAAPMPMARHQYRRTEIACRVDEHGREQSVFIYREWNLPAIDAIERLVRGYRP